jgi:hypothetical protein
VNRIELLRHHVWVREGVDEKNLVSIETETEDVLHHHLGFIFAEIQGSQASVGRGQYVGLVCVNGPQVGYEGVELANLSVGQSFLNLAPRSVQTEYLDRSG